LSLKIALVHKRLDLKGGTEKDLYRTAEGLRDLGHEVHLFCSEYAVPPPRGVLHHHVAVIPFGRTLRLWSFAVRAPKVVEAIGCDVVVSFGRSLDPDILRSGGGTHLGFLKCLGTTGGAIRRCWQRISPYHLSLLAMEKRQFESARVKKIIAVSAEVKGDILANYGVNEDRIAVLYNGVDHLRFHPARRATSRRSIREHWKIPADAALVLFVGSGFRRKGLDRILSMWSSIRLADVYLLIVGSDARMRHYQKWALSVAPDRIIFAGRQEDVENYYAAADILILPALQEAFGNVVLEALASGLPVLASRNVGAAEVLSGRLSSGIVENPDEPTDLENKILFLLESARDPKIAQEARKIGEKYSWDNHFRELDRIFHDVLIRRRQAVGVSGLHTAKTS
jgi:UDP-glucose:(heptosyl)LPS alpha-1,3-glucosyltransferase